MDDRQLITAYILGDLPADKIEQVQALMNASPELSSWARAVATVSGALGRAKDLEARFMTDAAQREQLYALAPAHTSPLHDLAGAVGRAVIAVLRSDSWGDAAGALALRGADGSRVVVFEAPEVLVEVRLVPSATKLHSYHCTGRIEGSPIDELTWMELDSGVSHRCLPDEAGFFDVEIRAGAHRLDVVIDGQRIQAEPLVHPPETRA